MSMSDNDFFGEYLFKPEEKNQELTKVDGLDQRQAALREMFQITYAGDIWEILGSLYDAGYRRAAPPAAAHGDEAALWELLDKSVYGSDEQQVVARAKIRRLLAMRAQGDGE